MALDVVDQLVRSSAVDVVVIDSVAGKQTLELLTLDIALFKIGMSVMINSGQK